MDEFIAEIFQIFKKELTLMFFKLFHKIKREGLLPNSVVWNQYQPDTKTDKNKHKYKNYKSISLINIHAKFLSKLLENRI
jgi:hypothetical protein